MRSSWTWPVLVLAAVCPAAARAEDVPRSPVEPTANDTRLFLAPTGHPLRRGEGYVSDHWVVFPGVAYGLTDNITLAGGMSVIPGVSVGGQALYFTPKLGVSLGPNLGLAVGGLLARADEVNVRLGYGVATFGTPKARLTAGVALGDAGDSEGERYRSPAILMIGGSARLSRRISLLSENWLALGDNFDLRYQPFSVGLRLTGDRLTVDLGVILIQEALDDGFPIPWLSASYSFGRR